MFFKKRLSFCVNQRDSSRSEKRFNEGTVARRGMGSQYTRICARLGRMNTPSSSDVTRATVLWVFFACFVASLWIVFVFWLVRYRTVKHYKAIVQACQGATTEEHYCPPEDAPVLDQKAFSETLQRGIQDYAREKIRQATSSTRTR